jgi:hypothetical protein
LPRVLPDPRGAGDLTGRFAVRFDRAGAALRIFVLAALFCASLSPGGFVVEVRALTVLLRALAVAFATLREGLAGVLARRDCGAAAGVVAVDGFAGFRAGRGGFPAAGGAAPVPELPATDLAGSPIDDQSGSLWESSVGPGRPKRAGHGATWLLMATSC